MRAEWIRRRVKAFIVPVVFFPVSILNTGEACLITSCVGLQVLNWFRATELGFQSIGWFARGHIGVPSYIAIGAPYRETAKQAIKAQYIHVPMETRFSQYLSNPRSTNQLSSSNAESSPTTSFPTPSFHILISPPAPLLQIFF